MYINFWYPMAKSEEVRTYEYCHTQVLSFKFFASRDNDETWRINLKKLRAECGDKAFTIPCPERRSSGN